MRTKFTVANVADAIFYGIPRIVSFLFKKTLLKPTMWIGKKQSNERMNFLLSAGLLWITTSLTLMFVFGETWLSLASLIGIFPVILWLVFAVLIGPEIADKYEK